MKFLKIIASFAFLFLVAACTSTTTTTNGVTTTTSTPVVTLAQAQAEAPILLANLKTIIATYESSASVDPTVKTNIDLAMSSLTVAVNSFVSMGPTVNYVTAGNAILTAANTIVGLVPGIDANTKAIIQGSISVFELVLPLLSQPAGS